MPKRRNAKKTPVANSLINEINRLGADGNLTAEAAIRLLEANLPPDLFKEEPGRAITCIQKLFEETNRLLGYTSGAHLGCLWLGLGGVMSEWFTSATSWNAFAGQEAAKFLLNIILLAIKTTTGQKVTSAEIIAAFSPLAGAIGAEMVATELGHPLVVNIPGRAPAFFNGAFAGATPQALQGLIGQIGEIKKRLQSEEKMTAKEGVQFVFQTIGKSVGLGSTVLSYFGTIFGLNAFNVDSSFYANPIVSQAAGYGAFAATGTALVGDAVSGKLNPCSFFSSCCKRDRGGDEEEGVDLLQQSGEGYGSMINL